MKKILLILMAVIGILATRVDASDWQKDDSDSRCGNRKSFVRDDQLTIIPLTADQRLLKFRECNPRGHTRLAACTDYKHRTTGLWV